MRIGILQTRNTDLLEAMGQMGYFFSVPYRKNKAQS